MVESMAQGSNVRVLTGAVRRALRRGAGRLGWWSGVSLAATAGLFVSTAQAELPVICVSGATCGNSNGIINNALSGVSGIAIAGNAMTVNQDAANAVLHWRSFNISSDASVNFVQPTSDSVALNRIYQNGASQIMGNLSANGRVYLINQNGIMFGNGAVVNVAGLIASSLDLSSLAISADGETRLTAPGLASEAAFRLFRDADGDVLSSGDITIGRGATITTKEGGQVFMFAPNVYNAGTIRTPGGQTVLAAGDSVYLASSADDNLRGIWVEVGTGGTVVNGVEENASVTRTADLVGQIIAERGNITLAGAAVNQLGRLTATTSVNEAGSIRLVARDGARITSTDPMVMTADRGGTAILGRNSVTEVQLDDSDATSVDSNAQRVSQVTAIGEKIVMETDASIIAPHGDVTFAACSDCGTITDTSLGNVKLLQVSSSSPDTSRIYLADGALIDVSGAHVENQPVESNVIEVELRGDELADSEVQRDGALRGETVYIDVRRHGTRADGTPWVGSPIGDLSGWVAGIEKDVSERSLTGGTVNLLSRGDAILNRGSTIDISGGSISYTGGYIGTSGLLGADGRVYDIADATPDREYVGVTNSGTYTVFDRRWGVTRTFTAGTSRGHYEQGYIEGKDAGTVSVVASRTLLDGTLRAETQVGRYQRQLSTELPADATALYRPYDELPLSGTLILGQSASGDQPDFVLSDVIISGSTTSQLPGEFDPLSSSLLAGSTLMLNSNLFGEDRVGNLDLRANGAVTIARDANLLLSPGGEMNVTAGAIEVAGSITTHGGDISLTARPTSTEAPLSTGLVVRSGAALDTSGMWVNDTAIANGGEVGTAALAVDGGTVTLQAQQNSLVLESGSVIDVSGGAQLGSEGDLVPGTARAINLSNTQLTEAGSETATTMTLAGDLRAYGFEDGGTLNLGTGAACIASAQSGCQQIDDDLLWLDPAFFAAGGFGSYIIGSNRGGIEVASGTTVTLRQRNWLAPTSGDLSRFGTGTSLDQIATVGLLEDIERQAVDLTLSVLPKLPGVGYTSESFADAASLVIGTGARVEGDVGANIDLSSTSRLLVDGTVSAAAGSISLALRNGLDISDSTAPGADLYFEDQGIWLGNNARLLARGAAVTLVDDQGRVVGDVLGGGTIAIDADRGHVITSSGSLIDVSGTSAALSVKADAQGRYSTRQVGSAAGTLDIEASEAILIGGDIKGTSGDPGKLAGGTLRVALDTSNRNDPGQGRADASIVGSALPGGDRTIELTSQPLEISFGDSTLTGYAGRAVVSAEQVIEGGFDALKLDARTAWTRENSQSVVHAGRIELAGDVSLALARSLDLNAAIIASDGGNATLSAPIVTLGNSNTDTERANSQYQAPALAGTGTLRVEGRQIDVVGTSVLQGFDSATLQSSGDLRLKGVQVQLSSSSPPALQGSLSTAGNLTLSAAQVYPTTLTQFTVAAGVDADDGTLLISQNGVAGDALSAGGALTLSAPKVVQSGTVRAPFGRIAIDSPSISLTEGSVTSTSGAGLSVLYGETEGGLDWVYVLDGSRRIIYGDGGQRIVDQRIDLNGDEVTLAEGAVLNVSGGGNLIATEFASGTTGTQDVLGEDNATGSFAIMPANDLHAAAYDQGIYLEAKFEGGRSIYLSGTDDLPAGEYIILPAKYALLPGAYLVTPVSGYRDITSGESYNLSDGSEVVAGYYTHTGSGLRDDARTSGFAILEGKAVQNKAKYTLTNANEFFAAQDESAATQRLPRDAGTVAITANESLTLEGTLQADAGQGGRGAALDIASSAIRVVADAAGAGDVEGALVLDAADLNSLGAESILLGGVRSEGGERLDIATSSSTVTIAQGAALQAPEVMLIATDTVSVERNASVTASGTEAHSQDVSLNGDGAFVRVATSGAVDIERNGATNSGRVIVADGGTLSASAGSIGLESSGDADLSGVLAAAGGEVSLTGNLISLGNARSDVSGWVLDAAQLSQLDASTLSLNSRSSIDWHGDVGLNLTNLNLNASALRGFDDGTVSITAAGNVTFDGAGSGVDPADSSASGRLQMSADNLIFADGKVELSGFDTVALLANREVRAGDPTTLDDSAASTDAAALAVVGGDLQLGAQRITTATGVDFSIVADGTATLSSSGATQALATVNELGGSFALEASAIELATRIELPSGVVTLKSTDAAQGGITMTGSSAIDVSGRATQFADHVAYSSGGLVNLDTASGNLVLAEGSVIDVSADGGANAGSIELTALAGNLQMAGVLDGAAVAGGAAGSFSADAQNLGDFTALAQRVASGGLAGDLSFRQRGAGDLTVPNGATVQGTSVSMTADQGSIAVAGGIISHDDDGGRINLSASNGMTISGTLDARSSRSAERNGRIGLNVSNGGLNVTNSAVIATSASGAATGTSGDGTVSIRLPQESLLTVVDADSGNDVVRLGGDWSRAGDVSVEGFAVLVDADGSLDFNDVSPTAGNPIYDAAAAFAAQSDAIATALSNPSLTGLEVLTGIEIRSGASDGSLSLDSDWNMAAWRFADSAGELTKAGVLTLRAAGNLTFNSSLSDGFTDLNDFRLDLDFGDSWSYNLIAGADTTSADVMATSRLPVDSNPDLGSVVIGNADAPATVFVRTGTGSIDVAAARDIKLSHDAAMIYTAGVASAGMEYLPQRGGNNQLGVFQGRTGLPLYYPTDGGDITLTAGRDVIGAPTGQLVSEWQWRIGNTNWTETRSTAWTVNFEQFRQGVGALAGGDVSVKAGNDINDLSVSVTTIGRQRANGTNDKSAAANDLEVIGGGNVDVTAGGDILGGSFYSGRGQMELRAGGEIGKSKVNDLAPLLLLGDTQASVAARKDVIIGGVATPTLLPQSRSQADLAAATSTLSMFSTYSRDSSLTIESTAGDISLVPDSNNINVTYGWIEDAKVASANLAFALLPGSVEMLAQRGSAAVTGTLIPDEDGALDVRAYRDVDFDVIVSDMDEDDIPDALRPIDGGVTTVPGGEWYLSLTSWASGRGFDLFNAATPVRLQAAREGRLPSSRIVAANGDVTGSGYFGAPVDIYAGNDVVDVDVVVQNLLPSDVSTITAGRDIHYGLVRGAVNDNGIEVDGPGQLVLTAGRNIDLGTSDGVTSRGDEVNTALADTGASITALAGLSGGTPDYAAFTDEYVDERESYIAALIDYVETSTGQRPANANEARAAFAAMGPKQQRVFLHRVLLAEIRASAEEAASEEKRDDYSRGFAALEMLFPGSTDADNNPYKGDISLYFSRIYTLDGGSIDLLTPGGGVNAGLAADTLETFGITKDSSELGLVTRRGGDIGIVADGDVQVNESRIFAVNDSDIVVWSSNGDVDAGRGAKTAISAPTYSVRYDSDAHAYVTYDAALSGSGIQARTATADQKRGNVVLAAPRGIVNAGDAGIVAGDLTIAATAVLGADNISVSGVAVGVPVDTGGLGASLAGVAASASSASKAAATAVEESGEREQAAAPIAEAALSWLEVFVLGLGEPDGTQQDEADRSDRSQTL